VSPPTVTLPPPTSGSPAGPVASSTPPPEPSFELPGVDTRGLDARERAQWSALVHELLAPCASIAVPVAQCVLEKRDCRACSPAAAWVARAVRDGKTEDQVRTAYAGRFDPTRVKSLPLEGSPMRGAADAPVTVVEFIDMECPHCRVAASVIDAVLAAHPGKVRVFYKSCPLSHHAHAEAAARAAVAAGRQGKFWEMERALLEGQDHLEPRDVEGYARSLKLDLVRWRADMASPSVAARVAQDRQLADDLQLKGTPTFYVAGRELDESDTLEERVRQELDGL